MSFFSLLVLLSLILVVPVFFVMKENSKRTQTDSIRRHKEYLEAASLHTTQSQKVPVVTKDAMYEQDNSVSVISFSAQHPFIKLLYNEQVPQTFRAIMDDIGQQYESTHHSEITETQLFTLNKFISTRVPELITDYLSLDKHYAKTVIIDVEKQSTSYGIVLDQLGTILDFAQKLNTQSQGGVVDKLLASHRYLNDVYKDSGMAIDSLKIK
ncbi:hypothetical protein ACT3QR_04240 [Psychrobacter sp. AOP7-B1-25]|uniref:hypothetical protein n=1 Tax=Psychrobacter sp. AOP7-B1-25 TaxID=3457644 RepID=UPI00402BB1EC